MSFLSVLDWRCGGGWKKWAIADEKNIAVSNGGSGGWRVARRVAVDGWQGYESREGIGAVRMVPVGAWQWQYWQR